MLRTCPSYSIQHRILTNISKVYLSDIWLYGISSEWMTKFKQQFELELDNTQTSEIPCGAIICDSNNENNEFISDKWWKILVSWYGLAKESIIIRQPVSPTYLPVLDGHTHHTVLSNKDTDYIELSVCLLSDFEEEVLHKRIKLFGWDTFDFVEYQIRRLFDISPKTKSRLWINIQENGIDIVFDILDEFSGQILTKISQYFPWLSKRLLDRGQNSPTGSANNNTNDPFLFAEKNIKVVIAFEGCAVDLSTKKHNIGWMQHAVELEAEGDSIVTLTTINSKWEELFTDCLDELSKEISEITTEKRGFLLNAAKSIVSEKLEWTEKQRVAMEAKVKRLEEKEKIQNERETVITKKEDDYKKKLVQYKDGLDSFMKEKNRLETEWKRVREQNMIKDSQITLNIGGEKFSTSLTTLTNVPDSFFVQVFCGTHVVKPCEDGSYFFDRDGTHFRHILNFLRNGPKAVKVIPNEESVLHEILSEAKYYELSEMEALIQEKIDNRAPHVELIGDMEYISYPSFKSQSSK